MNDLNKNSFYKIFLIFNILLTFAAPITREIKKPREEVFQRYDHYQH
jgi:hypothetical protein